MNNICKHHWVIEIPNGSTSNGICKLCGEHKEFINSFGEGVWMQNKSGMARTISPDEVDLELVG